ncbi:nuclear apoptosis-inducing factor 1 isoform X2 [Procambarus clarkii]|uniref:nuclear apoptosis-inducing factor 1 isoform X2 n=1 Tax=Procambarus clarkii TaxID=6728 RepID=UPI001E674F87|nr:nuclear apoptosis-inducing factor 1-like isoform X2 [Procambarus clarkii]
MNGSKKRKPNFTDEEVLMMLNQVQKRKKVILGKLDGSLTVHDKNNAWHVIAAAVTATSPYIRGPNEVRKKFTDLRSVVKKKTAVISRELRKAGGAYGDLKPLTATEEAMATLINDASCEDLSAALDNGDEYESGGGNLRILTAAEEAMATLISDTTIEDLPCTLDTGGGEDSQSVYCVKEEEFTDVGSPDNSTQEPSAEPSTSSAFKESELPSVEPLLGHDYCKQSEISGSKPPQCRSEHQISCNPPSRSRTTNKDNLIGPQMLKVQEEIRDSVHQMAESLQEMSSTLKEGLQGISALLKEFTALAKYSLQK